MNPIVLLLKRAGVSGRAFEREFGFAHQTMVNATAGTFEAIPKRIVDALAELCFARGVDMDDALFAHFGFENIQNAYQSWRFDERLKYKDLFQVVPRFGTKNFSPAFFYVKDTTGTQSQFAKKLKVPTASVMRWVSGATLSMPSAIEESLRDVGYPWISALIEGQACWVQEWGPK